MPSARRVAFRPTGPAALIAFGVPAVAVVFMAIYVPLAAVFSPSSIGDPSIVWGMPLFGLLMGDLYATMWRLTIVERTADGSLRITRPRVWPIPAAVRTVPIAAVWKVSVAARIERTDLDKARIVLSLHGEAADVPITPWHDSSPERLEPVARAITRLLHGA